MGPYAVAKSALAAYVDAVRLEAAPRGAHVLLVSPGPIRRADDGEGFDRYSAEVASSGLPPEANRPGGGGLARLDPDALAKRILEACRRRQSELVVPRKAAILAGIVEWCPDLGRRLLGRFTRPDGKNEG
jgi:short-subunit dehydrogenase